MPKQFLVILLFVPFICLAQADSVKIIEKVSDHVSSTEEMKVFYSQKLINANTVEVLRKGIMEFRVSHAFGDIGGSNGGVKNFFGLDNSFDVRIGFQAGLTNRLNVLLSRSKGASPVQQLYEIGLKYQFLRQEENDSKHPLSLTLFANSVVSSMNANDQEDQENSFKKFGDRTSEVVQLMIAKKIGKISLQLNPTFVTREYVINGDDKSLFSLGAGARIPLTSRFVFIADYFHTFRSQASKDLFADPGRGSLHFYDALGLGFEILTAGHIFHLNFTNATELLENRFIPRTVSNWGEGQFRWSFTISRNFIIFRDKKNK